MSADIEREAFEAHIRTISPKLMFIQRWNDGKGKYKHIEIQSMWEGWQARASQPTGAQGAAGQAEDSARLDYVYRIAMVDPFIAPIASKAKWLESIDRGIANVTPTPPKD